MTADTVLIVDDEESVRRTFQEWLAGSGPATQHREIHRQLTAFRESVEKVLPLVQSSAALNDPVPLPAAVAALCRFLRRLTGAADAVLLLRHAPAGDAAEACRVYDAA